MHGFGSQKFPDGSTFEGEFRDGVADNFGIYTYANGRQYHGKYVKGKREDTNGILLSSQGDIEYQGSWKNGAKHGEGMEIMNAAGENYKGLFKDDLREGLGIYRMADNSYYKGIWHQNTLSGKAVYKTSDGKVYKGVFKNYQITQGTLKWADGRTYEGEFRGLKQNGTGCQEWPNGDRYEGEWKDGQMHGKGAFTDAARNKREGAWKFDQFQ